MDLHLHFSELLHQITHYPLTALSIVVNLILIESLLSVDNAAVLATMVMDLPKDQRRKALRYGLLGAYFFRGLCLLFAFYLVQIWWIKPVGGIYLFVLALRHFTKKAKAPSPQGGEVHMDRSWLYRKTLGMLGPFWATVTLVEVMDLAFSIDNVIAANAYTKNLILIWVGVFIGILAMRFVAQAFVKLLEKYPFLDTCAYLVIALLGLKLTSALYTHFNPCTSLTHFLEGPQPCLLAHGSDLPQGEHPFIWGDTAVSVLSILIIFLPLVTSYFFNWPQRHKTEDSQQST